MNYEVLIFGAGKMGSTILAALIDSNIYEPEKIGVVEKEEERIRELKELFKQTSFDKVSFLDGPEGSDSILICVKPQDVKDVCEQIKGFSFKRVISIAAGIKCSVIEGYLGAEAKVIRAMPNIAISVSAGVTAICKGAFCNDTDLKTAADIFKTASVVFEVTEDKMDGITAVSGSGPAYLFYLAEQMIEAAKEFGLNEWQAEQMVANTLYGASKLLMNEPAGARELRFRVTSKGGTTEAAISTFEKAGLKEILKNAMRMAKTRSRELSES
jgi:pyrroline-5-carboxylate reductase